MNCTECNDTGVIETGNNDLPCSCPAGDVAMFNVAGKSKPVEGKVVKEENKAWGNSWLRKLLFSGIKRK
jgi:hypothetical protein